MDQACPAPAGRDTSDNRDTEAMLGNASPRKPNEPTHSRSSERRDLAGGVPRQGQRDLLRFNSVPVVAHANQGAAAALEFDFDVLRTRIDGVFHQLLDHGRRPLDDLAGSDLTDQSVG